FEAEFSEDVGVFLPAHVIEAAVETAVTMRPPERGRKYVAAVDASAGGDNAFTLAIAFADGEQVVGGVRGSREWHRSIGASVREGLETWVLQAQGGHVTVKARETILAHFGPCHGHHLASSRGPPVRASRRPPPESRSHHARGFRRSDGGAAVDTDAMMTR